MDAKDILGLPKNTLPIPQEKKSRTPKDSQRKPDGISREVSYIFVNCGFVRLNLLNFA
jgi:hypothetical protein